ncbi:hypothetical protein CDAR_496001 [Caerostris darwini]|uniref:Uncharacterized protein n=1 Tax=Caerostris darwini TaxID=1538125 RepID=A0AAV4U1N6_9ARAC|nr:hypothetical protein CDAR_496001 [Caerostris darwini]
MAKGDLEATFCGIDKIKNLVVLARLSIVDGAELRRALERKVTRFPSKAPAPLKPACDLILNRGLFEEIVDELCQEYHRVVFSNEVPI